MSEEAKKHLEEEQIGKTYDLRVTKRLLRYLKPYWYLVVTALIMTLVVNIVGSLQPRFTQYAVDDYITPKQTEGLWFFVILFFSVFFFRFLFSYLQEILLNTVGQRVMFDLRTEIFPAQWDPKLGIHVT